MSFKTNRPPDAAAALSGFSLLGFVGADAAAFLQAQTMNDLQALAAGHWQWNGWLNAKGRVIALFALLKLAEDEFIAVLPDFPAAELLPLLQRFVFRSKTRLQVISEWVAATELEPTVFDSGATRDAIGGDRETGWRLDFGGATVQRQLLLLPSGDPRLLPADAARDADWLSADLAHGLPRLPASQREAWTPQMLSLDRLHAFSLKKGCYPGQEIVARTHYLGQARRSLSRVQGIGLELDANLTAADGAVIGKLICVTPDGGSGLAVLQSEQRTQGVWIGAQALLLPDFLDGLQRPV